MVSFLKTRLGAMMFLQYVIWGAWYVTLNTYLTSTLKFSGTEAGAVFGTTALASLVAPFLVGLIADRLFATERVLAALYALGAVFLLLATQVTSFGAVYLVLLAFCLCYFPTIALTNSITMQQVADPGREFPKIRMLGTIGWIVIGFVVGYLQVEAGTMPFLLGAGASVVMCVYSLVALPHTPPRASGQKATLRSVLGLDALAMLKDPTYLVFVIASVLACIPLTFYYSFTNAYLNEVGVSNAAGKMTLGQVSEIGMMLLMPLVFRVATVRWILLVGLLSWAARYVLLAYGDPGPGVWMFYLAIIMHGVCFDFFFVTGQLYTDQQAPPHLRSTAQGFITAMTYGVGMLVGSLLSGGVLDYFSKTAADGDDHARLDRVLADVRVDVVCDHAARALLLPHERANQGQGRGLDRPDFRSQHMIPNGFEHSPVGRGEPGWPRPAPLAGNALSAHALPPPRRLVASRSDSHQALSAHLCFYSLGGSQGRKATRRIAPSAFLLRPFGGAEGASSLSRGAPASARSRVMAIQARHGCGVRVMSKTVRLASCCKYMPTLVPRLSRGG